MGMPGSHDLTIPRGKTFTVSFRKKAGIPSVPLDLTGWKVRGQIRTRAGQYGITGIETLVLDMTDGNEVEITDAVNGLVSMNLTSTQTIALNTSNTQIQLAYEIELYNDSAAPETVDGLIVGLITIIPETAR